VTENSTLERKGHHIHTYIPLYLLCVFLKRVLSSLDFYWCEGWIWCQHWVLSSESLWLFLLDLSDFGFVEVCVGAWFWISLMGWFDKEQRFVFFWCFEILRLYWMLSFWGWWCLKLVAMTMLVHQWNCGNVCFFSCFWET
jgi:hypothetical protein